jgi:hypothetical protein
MNFKTVYSFILSTSLTLATTSSFSEEADITLKHATAPSGSARNVNQSSDEPLVPHLGPLGTKGQGASATDNNNKPRGSQTGSAKRILPGTNKFKGIEPDEID